MVCGTSNVPRNDIGNYSGPCSNPDSYTTHPQHKDRVHNFLLSTTYEANGSVFTIPKACLGFEDDASSRKDLEEGFQRNYRGFVRDHNEMACNLEMKSLEVKVCR